MTDNDIIKALEGYREHTLLAFDGGRPKIDVRDILGVIARQKAEIERLQTEKIELRTEAEKKQAVVEEMSVMLGRQHKIARAEAIKEFAERLKEHELFIEDDDRYVGYAIRTKDIDNLVKEMVGERE